MELESQTNSILEFEKCTLNLKEFFLPTCLMLCIKAFLFIVCRSSLIDESP